MLKYVVSTPTLGQILQAYTENINSQKYNKQNIRTINYTLSKL